MEATSSAAPPVPPSAHVLVEIANSRALSVRPDLLATPAEAVALLRTLALLPEGGTPTEADLDEIREFRSVLNRLLAGGEDTEVRTTLNTLARRVALNADFTSEEATLTAAPGTDRPLARLVIHLFRTVSDNTWPRVRLCANEECAAAFYDTTRSRTQRWHSYTDCGNKSNVAAHRARARAAKTG
ncbi:CGNR zinc finger domain-containing protein [Streptomyces sp. J2-1]|uniref:CGNR zinc finger domain-containing protein n=1 Tax=Streptomyces corallincola TaxID=2851888 RepID=UPI001C3926E1|nr:CGNR zinc finger domain-containing protein [Streptomyces corallincola]MBV2353812.1 CGNR zinc finger domain-containing protein [Streptomyces corallincola]